MALCYKQYTVNYPTIPESRVPESTLQHEESSAGRLPNKIEPEVLVLTSEQILNL